MTKRKYLFVTFSIVIAGLFTYGCSDFLDIPAKGSLGEEVLSNRQGVETALIGAYGALDGAGVGADAWAATPANWVYGSMLGGDAHKGSEPSDQAPMNPMMAGDFLPTSGFYNGKWRATFEGISRANATLRILENVDDMTDIEKARIEGEARFLRGHYYFELRKMFYRVPWIDEHTEDLNQPNDSEIWQNIEADFQYGFDNLPETQSDAGRVNRWAAASYLARTYVYQEKWSDAKALYDQIIPNGVTTQGVPYDLANSFWDNWNPALEDGLPEAVFSVQQVANDGTGGINNANQGMMLNFPNDPNTFGCCGFYSPTQDLVNSYRTENGLPIIENYNNDMVKWDLGVPSSEQFEPYDGELDPRLDWTVGRRGVPYHDWGPFPGTRWMRDQLFGGPYHAKKNIYWRSQEGQYADRRSWAPGTAINIPVIRFADVLLMAAEAEIEAGSLEQARNYVNLVRERAAHPDTWVSNELNREFASANINSEPEMLGLDLNVGEWVIREDTGTTFTYIGGDGGPGNINNWNEYDDPNYNIAEYSTPWTDQASAREAVRFERKLELAMEGHRFFDLVRWGVAQEVLSDFYEYEGSVLPNSGFAGAQFRNEYFPIPQRQIDLGQGTLQQNPGY